MPISRPLRFTAARATATALTALATGCTGRAHAHTTGPAAAPAIESSVGLDHLYCGQDGRIVGDVQLNRPRAELLGGPSPAFRIPAAEMDGVAGGDELAGGVEPETLVRSGDQGCCHSSVIRR